MHEANKCLAVALTLLVKRGVFTEYDIAKEASEGYDNLFAYLYEKIEELDANGPR